VKTVKRLAERFKIESVMTFGGEPLLYADTVCEIHAAARDCGIPERQLITNGFFSRDERRIEEVAHSLRESGVNDLLLSVDAFHQEYIPIESVVQFAEALLKHGANLRVHPAWVVNEATDNAYNMETKRLLKIFTDKGIAASEGNNIFPAGNAAKYLSEYYAASGAPEKPDLTVPCGSQPYTEPLDKISCLGINPNGDVNACALTIGNICNEDILEIIDRYDPYKTPAANALLTGGVPELIRYAKSAGVTVDTSDCRSACGVCRKIMEGLS